MCWSQGRNTILENVSSMKIIFMFKPLLKVCDFRFCSDVGAVPRASAKHPNEAHLIMKTA